MLPRMLSRRTVSSFFMNTMTKDDDKPKPTPRRSSRIREGANATAASPATATATAATGTNSGNRTGNRTSNRTDAGTGTGTGAGADVVAAPDPVLSPFEANQNHGLTGLLVHLDTWYGNDLRAVYHEGGAAAALLATEQRYAGAESREREIMARAREFLLPLRRQEEEEAADRRRELAAQLGTDAGTTANPDRQGMSFEEYLGLARRTARDVRATGER